MPDKIEGQSWLLKESPEQNARDLEALHSENGKHFTGVQLRAHWLKPQQRRLVEDFRAAFPDNLSRPDARRGGRDTRTETEVFLSNLEVYSLRPSATEVALHLGIEYGYPVKIQLPNAIKIIHKPDGKDIFLLPAVAPSDLVPKKDPRRALIQKELGADIAV